MKELQLAKWLYLHQWQKSLLPKPLLPWLVAPDSMTARLKGSCQRQFKVRILEQSWRRPLANECLALNLQRRERALVREVELFCDGKAWMYARSIFPQQLFSGKTRYFFNMLDDRPIGETMLFTKQSMQQRDPFQIAKLSADCAEYQLAAQNQQQTMPPILWARRSVFKLSDKPLLVSETFFTQNMIL